MVKCMRKVAFALVVLLMAAACAFIGGGFGLMSAKAAEAEKPTIDMTKASYVDAMELGDEGMWENSSTVINGYLRLCDGTGNFVYKVILPADTTYFNMQMMVAQRVLIFISNDGTFPAHTPDAPSEEADFDKGTEWYFDTDLSEYIKTSKTVYIKFADPTPIDGNGALIRYIRFNHNGTVTMPTYDDSHVSAVTEESKTQSFKVNDADLTAYKVADNGGTTGDAQQIKFYDGATSVIFEDASKNNGRGILNSAYGVYKFTYSEDAQKVRIVANLGQGYVFSVSNSITEGTEGDYTDQTKWTHLGGGKGASGKIGLYSFDVTAFMNANKTIYFRIADAVDLGGNGGYFLGADLYETKKATAPIPVKPVDLTVTTRTLGQIELPAITVTSADNNCAIAYTVKNATDKDYPVTAKKFTPDAFGVYTVTATATDGNGSTGSTVFTVTVSQKNYAVPTITKPDDISVTQKTLSEITLPSVEYVSEDPDAVLTYAVKDKDGKVVTVSANKFTPTAFGDYTVTATVTDGDEQSESVTFTVTVKSETKKGCTSVGFDSTMLLGGGILLLMAAALATMSKRQKA